MKFRQYFILSLLLFITFVEQGQLWAQSEYTGVIVTNQISGPACVGGESISFSFVINENLQSNFKKIDKHSPWAE